VFDFVSAPQCDSLSASKFDPSLGPDQAVRVGAAYVRFGSIPALGTPKASFRIFVHTIPDYSRRSRRLWHLHKVLIYACANRPASGAPV
jgi:hypothetical protein